MPFSTRNLHHLETPTTFSIGPSSTFLENFEAGTRRQNIVESMWGLEVDLENAYTESLRLASEVTGRDMQATWGLTAIDAINAMEAGAMRELGEDFYKLSLPKTTTDRYLAEIDKREAELAKLHESNLKIKTFKQIFYEEKLRRLELIRETDNISERAHTSGTIAHFLGNVWGSFDPERDPLYFGSMFIPLGAGRALLTKLLMEGALGGGVEAIQQGLFVQPKHRALGEPTTNLLTSIAAAAVGSAAFRGVLEGGAGLYRYGQTRFGQDRARARVVREVIESHLNGNESLALPRLTDAQLRTAVEKLKQTEQVATVKVALAKDAMDDATSPHPPTREGRILTQLEMAEAVREFEGLPPDPKLAQAVNTQQAKMEARQPSSVIQQTPAQLGARLQALEYDLEKLADELTGQVDLALKSGQTVNINVDGKRVNITSVSKGMMTDAVGQRWGVLPLVSNKADWSVEIRPKPEQGSKTVKPLSRKTVEKLGPLERERLRVFRSVLERLQRGEEVSPGLRQDAIEAGFTDKDGNLTPKGKGLLDGTTVPEGELVPSGNEVFKMVDEFVPEEQLDEMLARAVPEAKAAIEGTPVATTEIEASGLGRVAVEISEDGTFDLGGQTVRADLDVPNPDGTTRTAIQVMEEIADEDALARAAAECGLP